MNNDIILTDVDGSEITLNDFGAPIIYERPIDDLDDYYKINRMSNSRMKIFRRSPRHYIYSLTHFEETPAMVLGRAFHAIVLEEDKFDDMFYRLDITRRPEQSKGMTSKINQAWKHSEILSNGKKSFISDEDFDRVRYMRDAMLNDPFSAELFQEVGEVEKPIFWTDPITGVEIKAKLDATADDFTIDLKSCVNAKPEVFSRHAFDMDYPGQAALYRDGRSIGKDEKGKRLNMEKGDFYFIAVEKEPPFGVSVNKASRDFISYGEDQYNRTLSDFNYWREMGAPDVCYEWRKPMGYSTLKIPYWAK